MVGAAALAWTALRPGAQQRGAAGLASVSAADGTGTGCSNWKEIKLLEFRDVDQDICKAKCDATANCYHYNYHPDQCQGSKDAPKTCFLFAKGCVLEESPCWNLYENPTVPTWGLRGNATGCANWEAMTIGRVHTAMNRGQCGVKCSQHDRCRLFNFQPHECNGAKAEHVAPAGAGACYLYTDDPPCTDGHNECWDLYGMLTEGSVGNSTWSLLAAAKHSDVIRTSDDASFRVADVVSIQFADTSVQTFVVMGKENPGLSIDPILPRDLLGDELIWIVPAQVDLVAATLEAAGLGGNGSDGNGSDDGGAAAPTTTAEPSLGGNGSDGSGSDGSGSDGNVSDGNGSDVNGSDLNGSEVLAVA